LKLNAEITIQELLGTLVSDPNQWDGLKYSENPINGAYMKGY
jgi:hypothetical protein